MSETLRFSNAAVPDGKVPSTGICPTRRSSPRPAIIGAITSRTNGGALSGTSGKWTTPLVAASGTRTSWRCASASSTAWKFLRTTSPPLSP